MAVHQKSGGNFSTPLLKLIPAVLLALYSGLMALAFYYMEDSGDCPMEDYWTSLYFVGTIYTTIGYGTVCPCTTAGKAVTIIFALTSFPLAIITLDNIGFLFAKFFSWIYRGIKSCMCRGKVSPERAYEQRTLGEILPLPLGLLLTVVWIGLMSLYFALLEDLKAFDAVYFVFVSITTIGFGDIAPTKMEYVIADYAMLMIGLALFSMCVNLVQESIENMMQRIIMQIMKEYQESQLAGESMDDEQDPKKMKQKMNKIIKKQPGGAFLRPLLGQRTVDSLIEQYQQRSRMRVKGTQVEITYADQEVSCVPEVATVSTQTEYNMRALRYQRSDFYGRAKSDDDAEPAAQGKYDPYWKPIQAKKPARRRGRKGGGSKQDSASSSGSAGRGGNFWTPKKFVKRIQSQQGHRDSVSSI